MSAVTTLTIVLLIAATAACVALIWLSKELVDSARSLRLLSDETRERLVPLLDKADITVDAANAELLRIDAAITRFEDASVKVGAATETISEIVQAPADIVTGVAGRVRRAWKERKHHAPPEAPAHSEAEPETVSEEILIAAEPEQAEAMPQDEVPGDELNSSEDPWPRIE